jgi:hypothetical protein
VTHIDHLTLMRGRLHTRRLHSRRVCKPTRIAQQLEGKPQRGRRQSASQRQQQVPTLLCDSRLHATFTSFTALAFSCMSRQVAEIRNMVHTEQAVQRRLLGARQRRQQAARVGRPPKLRTAAASRQPRDKVRLADSGE